MSRYTVLFKQVVSYWWTWQSLIVLTMYEKGGRRVAWHAWIGECQNIGTILYMVVQLWQQSLGQWCLFKAIHGSSSHLALPHFAHIPSTSFLYALPAGFASRKGDDIKINVFFMDTVFAKLFSLKSLITECVHNLQSKSSSSKDEEPWKQCAVFFLYLFLIYLIFWSLISPSVTFCTEFECLIWILLQNHHF